MFKVYSFLKECQIFAKQKCARPYFIFSFFSLKKETTKPDTLKKNGGKKIWISSWHSFFRGDCGIPSVLSLILEVPTIDCGCYFIALLIVLIDHSLI